MGDPGLSLFDQKHLTLHLNNDEEEDEAAIRYAKEKDDEIKEELARAFLNVDDDDEDDHEGPSGSSSSDEEEGYQAGNIKDNSTKVHRTNGLIFNSDNSHNLLNESDVSRNTAPERPALANGEMFSPSRRESSGFAQTSGGNMEYLTVNGGRGDGNHHFQTWSNANNFGHREHFEKSLEESVGDYRQVNGGRGDAGEHLQMWNGTNYGQNEQFDNSHGESTGKYSQGLGENEVPERYHQQVFSNNSHNENDKPFKPIFSSDGSKTFDKSDEDYILAYKHTEDNVEQLRVLLDVQERELKRLTEQLETERQQSAKYKNEMFRKCALMEGEKERALLSRDELSKLLISSKEQINMLQTEVQSLKEIIAAMEKNKKKSDEMEELGRIQIQELEERIAMMERCDPSKNLAKQQDMMVKELKNKHQQDVVMLQKQIENLNKKLLQKEEDCSGLEKRMAELQREHEMLLVDKGNTINQLSRQLDESQAQCRQLMAANVSVENVRLQNQLDEVAREKDRLNETVRTLQIECNMMRSELAQYETVSRLNLPQSNSSSEESDSIVQLGMSTRTSQSQQLGRTNLNQTDTICKLKAELNRSFLNQKAKRAEIQRLTQIVNEKEDQVQELVKRERVYVAQFETLNDQLNKMKAEFKCLKSEQQKVDSCDRSEEISNLNTVIAELRKEKVVMEREKLAVQQELEDLKKDFEADKKREISDCNKEYLKFHDQTVATVKKEIEEKADLQVKEYSIRLEQSLKELSEVKEMYLSVCTAKEQLALSLQERTAELGQVTEKKEQLTRELQELTVMRDQLARRLNERETSKIRNQTGNKNENEEQIAEILQIKTELHKAELQINSSRRNENQLSAECKRLREELSVMSARLTVEINSARKLEQVTADKDRLAAELQEMRDHLAHKLTEQKTAETAASHVEAKEENDKLNAEILRLKTELQKAELLINTSQRRESQLSAECERLREDLSAMSARHTLEISSAREELRDSRERLIQLEKNARTQFETEMKSLRQDRDMLKTKCDEKEVQIMKLIESRKRAPATVTVATETEDEEEEKQQRELIRCQEEYNRVLVDMEQGHRQALRKLREEYNNERMALVQEHKQQLQAVEEHTKQLTVKFFAEEVKKLEAKYVDEVSNVVENLQKSLLEKNCLVENLQKRLISLEDEWREKLVALNREMEAEKEIAAQMMVQWAEEMKKIQEELARKEEVIENQRTKLAKAKAMEQRHREKLIRNNEVFQTQYKKKCDEFKEIFKEAKEEAFEKLKQLDKVYEDEIKKIQKKEEMRIKALEKKLQQKS